MVTIIISHQSSQILLAIITRAMAVYYCLITTDISSSRLLLPILRQQTMKWLMKDCVGLFWFVTLSLTMTTTLFTHCYAGGTTEQQSMVETKTSRKVKTLSLSHLGTHHSSSDPYNYVGSPFTLPPFDDTIGSAPSSSPQQSNPIYCVYPSPISTTPSSPFSFSPIIYQAPPPPPQSGSETPIYEPSPPNPNTNPPVIILPSPPAFVPEPPIFQSPIVYPPPPSTGGTATNDALWCVAKPSVPDPIIQEAMNYACGSGADCDSIQPSGSCYQPDTVIAHASFAFNSYWQQTKVIGGTCDFGGSAMLVTNDPSFDGCLYIRD